MKNKTAEEVYVEMLKPAETVTLKVLYRPDDFNMLKDVPGDGFYIRYTHIDTHYKCMTIITGHLCVLLYKKNHTNVPQQPRLCPCAIYKQYTIGAAFG